MNLDIHTLAFATCIAIAMQTIAIFIQFIINRTYKGIGWWIIGFFSILLGLVSILLRGFNSIELYAIIATNLFFLFGLIAVLIGIMCFLNKRANLYLLFSFLIIYIVIISFFTFIKNDTNIRIIIFSFGMSTVLFITAWEQYNNDIKSIRVLSYFNAIVFLIDGCYFALRGLITIFSNDNEGFFTPTFLQSSVFLVQLIFGFLSTLGLLIMVNRRLNAESVEDKDNLELIFNTIPDIVLITRFSDGSFVRVNDGFTSITGYTLSELKGKTFNDINIWKKPEDRQQAIDLLKNKGNFENLESVFLKKNGDEVYGMVSSKIISLQGIPHIISITRDITNLKRIDGEIKLKNEQLLEANYDKDRFISILAHDLKSSFNSILGFLELLQKNIRIYEIEKIEKQINIVNSSAQNTFNLLEDILMWARTKSGKISFNPSNINFTAVCNEVIETVNLTASSKNISIKHYLDEQIIVFADIDMLKAVLRNLISNAIKFSNPGGQIVILHKKRPSKIAFSIIDKGIGISPDKVESLFKTSQTTKGTRNEGGTGFGLTLCKDCIERQGGEIWVTSELGNGSVFSFTLPVIGH